MIRTSSPAILSWPVVLLITELVALCCIVKSEAIPNCIFLLSPKWIKSDDKVKPAPIVTIPAVTFKLPALKLTPPETSTELLTSRAAANVETPAVTTIPPVVALNPFPAVTKPTESILVTSS